MKKQIQIALVDDHGLFREGLKDLLSSEPQFQVVAEAGDGLEALGLVAKHKLDVLIMDLRLPRMGGIPTIKRIRETYKDLKIIVVSMFEDEDHKREAILAGANGYFSKMSDSQLLIQGIKKLMKGEDLIPSSVLEAYQKIQKDSFQAGEEFVSLTESEYRLLDGLGQGKSNREMALEAHASERTIKNQLSSLFKKLGVKTRVDALRVGIQKKYISLNT